MLACPLNTSKAIPLLVPDWVTCCAQVWYSYSHEEEEEEGYDYDHDNDDDKDDIKATKKKTLHKYLLF